MDRLAEIVKQLAEAAEIDRQDMREAIANLIVGNEVTRELAQKAGQLAINTSQHLTTHQEEPHK
ncbi:MAG TPA: hypothetical protein VJX67_12465 [Blastocatellia bacterium]|nr:hypothetical protein [Blastocatellia bacterium]